MAWLTATVTAAAAETATDPTGAERRQRFLAGGRPGLDPDRRRDLGPILGFLHSAAVVLVGGAFALSGCAVLPSPPPAPSSPAGPASPSAAASIEIGLRVTWQLEWSAAVPYSAERLATALDIIRRRVDATGAVGMVVESAGEDRIVVGIPTGIDPTPFRELIGPQGRVTFVPLGSETIGVGDLVDPTRFPALLGSEEIAGAAVAVNQTLGRVIEIDLSSAGAERFGAYTAAHVGDWFAITIDGVAISVPTVDTEIPGGRVQISKAGAIGGWDAMEASRLTTIIQLGPLPVPLREISAEPGPIEPSASPTSGDGRSPSPSAGPSQLTFVIERTPPDLGCDAIAPPYRWFVIHIDPRAPEPVWAIADTNARLRVTWGSNDRGLVGPPPVIVDGTGLVIAHDGTRIDIPPAAWPSLAGRFVCPSQTTVYITDQPAG